ncbi:hypothetical protein C2E23DRAFT_41963 [Lenzites betulinus]|nr:hypothetical protein C2E23DRAFT_41963 [Lenzites betulinus]
MSQMNPRRRSTVHDLAALRLHRDGTRVLNSDTNRSSRRAKYATQDSRGNWIARDAGGLANVKQRRSASRPEEHDEVSGSGEDEEVAEDTASSPRMDKGKGRAREDEASEEEPELIPRARKRRRFDEDFSYLTSVSTPALAPPTEGENLDLPGDEVAGETLPVPSSDLLKSLHYFASTYYTAMGQLYDAPREARRLRKARRLEKAKAARQAAGPSRANSERAGPHEAPHSSGEDEIELSEDDLEDPMDDHPAGEQEADAGKRATKTVRRKKGPRQVRPMEKDMYKILDGSALMALGMLFQEHVAEMLEPMVPEGWEREMAKADREKRVAARNARKAKAMKARRRPEKKDTEDTSDEETESRSGSRSGKGSSGETDSVEGVDEERPSTQFTLKQSSSAPQLGSSDDSDDSG